MTASRSRLSTMTAALSPAGQRAAQMFQPYQRWLTTLSPAELAAETARLGALIEEQNQQRLAALLTSRATSSAIDAPVLRSDPMANPSSAPPDRRPDRGSPRSAPAPGPSSLDLLASGARMGPRLAARLVLADARRQRRKRDGS